MNALEIHNLCKTYQGQKRRSVEALRSLSLTVETGEVFGFLGPNGAGKSTAIKTLMGLISPTSGSAHINGRPVSEPEARLATGYLPENPSFYDFLTGREYLAFVGSAFGMDQNTVTRESLRVLKLLHLENAADRYIRSYSKGMVQRIGLAQVLIHDPDIYILDEPMSGLDPLGRALVKDIIRDLKGRGKTVFFSTHVTADVEAVCDRVGIIVGGSLKAVERVEHILQSGVEGYSVRVAAPLQMSTSFEWTPAPSGVAGEYFVPKQELNGFMTELIAHGIEVQLIEPKRKDIEKFFLEIVGRGNA